MTLQLITLLKFLDQTNKFNLICDKPLITDNNIPVNSFANEIVNYLLKSNECNLETFKLLSKISKLYELTDQEILKEIIILKEDDKIFQYVAEGKWRVLEHRFQVSHSIIQS